MPEPHIVRVCGQRQVNKARSLAVATLVFAIISCIGFAVPSYWFPCIGGVLATIGCSIILCGNYKSKGHHLACGILNILAALFHAAGIGIYVWFYASIVLLIDSSATDEAAGSAVIIAFFITWLIWPVMVLVVVAFILEVIQAVFCFQARSAIVSGEFPGASQGGQSHVVAKQATGAVIGVTMAQPIVECSSVI